MRGGRALVRQEKINTRETECEDSSWSGNFKHGSEPTCFVRTETFLTNLVNYDGFRLICRMELLHYFHFDANFSSRLWISSDALKNSSALVVKRRYLTAEDKQIL